MANMTPRDRNLIAIAAIALVAAGAFWYWYYNPKASQLSAMKTHVDSLEVTNKQVQAELKKHTTAELHAEAVAFQQNLALMRQLVPTSNEVPSLLEQVSTAARRVGLDIGDVTPQPVIPGPQFDTYRYQITVIGGYHPLAEFTTNVGALTRIIAPVQFDLKEVKNAETVKRRGKTGQAVLEATYLLQTYVSHQANTPVVAPASGGKKS